MSTITAKRLPRYWTASIGISMGGFLFGFDTGSIGPITVMTAYTDTFGSLSPTLRGAVVSSILLPAAFTGLFAGNLADVYGRLRSISWGAAIFGIGAALECSSFRLVQFITGRVAKGLGEGVFLGILVVYICEVTPVKRRGQLGSLVQFLVVLGIAAGYFVAYGTSRIAGSSLSWRLPLVLHAILAFSFALLCCALPPSPRHLLEQGKRTEALYAFQQLGLPQEEIELAMAEPIVGCSAEAPSGIANSIKTKLKDFAIVLSKGHRKQTGLACFMMAMQQFSGIDGVLYYAPLLFQQAGLSSEQSSFLASGVSALCILIITIPASVCADRWGRRTSTIVGGLLLTMAMYLIGSLYAAGAVHRDHGAARWVVIVTIYLYSLVYAGTWAISFRIYASEIQPRATRASATCIAQSANWCSNWIVAFTTPIMLSQSSYGAYFFFGSCCIFTVMVCAVVMPETKSIPLEKIEAGFLSRSSKTSAQASNVEMASSARNMTSLVAQRLRWVSASKGQHARAVIDTEI